MKHKIKLSNNLNFIYHKNPYLHSVNISLFFRVGQLYENKHNYGVTHLTEHMFFRSLNNISQEELYYKMESIGTTIRGSTYREMVYFDITVSPEFFIEGLSLISEILKDFNWKNEDLEKEKQVVINQITFSSNSYADEIDKIYFELPPFSMPILGTLNSVNRLTVDDINDWKKKFFTCDNCCCVITGNFDDNNIKSAIAILEKIVNPGILQERINILPQNYKQRSKKSDTIFNNSYEESDIFITFDIEDIMTKENYYARILSSILGDGDGSILSLRLREKEFLTDEITSRVELLYGSQRLLIECTCLNKNVDKVILAIFNEIEAIKNEISDRQYNSCINFFTKNQKFTLDDPRKLGFYYGLYNFILNEQGWCIDSDIKKYEKIKVDELSNMAKKIFIPRNLTINVYNNNKIVKKSYLESLFINVRKNLLKP